MVVANKVQFDSEQFRRARVADLAQDSRRNRTTLWAYKDAADYKSFTGPADLIRWFEWYGQYEHWLPPARIEPLIALSEQYNRKIVEQLEPGTPYRFQHIDEYNATDYVFQNLYPVPDRMRPQRLLDFGPGIGRQINLWSQLTPGLVYVGMEAIELPYTLQRLYYSHFPLHVHEYLDHPLDFRITSDAGIYHLPTWRADLLPEAFFDLAMCVQVLPELPKDLVLHMLGVFRRVLKPGGALYIRDHGTQVPLVHRINMEAALQDAGFVLEYRPYVVDSHHHRIVGHPFPPDVHGIPRIWRRRDDLYPVGDLGADLAKKERWNIKKRLRSVDAFAAGKGEALVRRFVKR